MQIISFTFSLNKQEKYFTHKIFSVAFIMNVMALYELSKTIGNPGIVFSEIMVIPQVITNAVH